MPDTLRLTVQVQQITDANGTEQIAVSSNIDASTPNVWGVVVQVLMQGVRAAVLEEVKQSLDRQSRLVQPFISLSGLENRH